MSEAPKIMIVMPTYNEAENIPVIVPALFAEAIENMELLVVDDNSPDGTGQLVLSLHDEYDGRIHLLNRTENRGFGAAYIAGFKKALAMGADLIVQMDADGSHKPEYIPSLLDALAGHDLVIGSRFVKGGGVDENWGFIRKLLSWWANRLYTPAILRIPVYDSTAGFRAWRRDTLIGIDLDRIQSNGYVFQVEMAYVTHELGYKIVETPIYFPDRELGESKMIPTIAVEASLRVWQILWRHRHLSPEQRRTATYTI